MKLDKWEEDNPSGPGCSDPAGSSSVSRSKSGGDSDLCYPETADCEPAKPNRVETNKSI